MEVENSRVFCICGRAAEPELLQSAFAPYGIVQSIKLVREKGVAYVRYDRASSAALAIEHLNGAVLNEGRGPKLKVLLAETPTPRGVMMPAKMLSPEPELSSDPDNVPLRSRLFIVVPKQADVQQIQADFASFPDLEYCKTDLVAAKGVVFCKFSKASSALRVLEEITDRGCQVAGYKVKCMLAEPKTKRGRPDMAPQDPYAAVQQYPGKMDYNFGMPMDAMYGGKMTGGLSRGHVLTDPYAGMMGGAFSPLHSVPSMGHLTGMEGLMGLGLSTSGLHGSLHGSLQMNGTPSMSPHAISRQRLFVVVHKAVAEDLIARLFRRYPGMEYCDLKKDRATGKSKGYAYVNYSTPEAASAAVDQLNGVEFPYQSGHRIKVMFAEPLGSRPSPSLSAVSPLICPSADDASMQVSPSPMHTPGLVERHLAADVAAMTDSLAGLSLPPSGSGMGMMDDPTAHHLGQGPPMDVARELIFMA